MRKTSIRSNLLNLFFISLLVMVCVSMFLNTFFLEKYHVAISEKHFAESADEIKEILKPFNRQNFNELQFMQHALFEIDRLENMTIIVADRNYRPLVASYPLNGVEQAFLNQEIIFLIENHREQMRNDQYLYMYIKTNEFLENSESIIYIEYVPENAYYIILTRPLKIVQDNIYIANQFSLIAGFLSFFVGALVTMKFSKSFTQPIVEISQITQNMTQLDFTQKIEYTSNNELGLLAGSINLLSLKLELNIENLKNEIDFQKVLARNVSHELKTPIAVIKGYAEGLYYGIADTDEMREEYLNVVIKECNRMDALVKEMLTLSKLNAQNYILNQSIFSTKQLEAEINQLCFALLEKYEIDLSIIVEEFELEADFELLLQVMRNFISNAVKYGDRNKIKIAVYQQDKNCVFSVFNTGEAIPEKELQKIFDTFYTLDTARNRDVEGHGLGLSIVKSIAHLHHGKVCAKNQENGVVFVLKIKQK